MNTKIDNNVKSTEEYWSTFWKNQHLPDSIIIHTKELKFYPFRCFDNFYRKIFEIEKTKGMSLIEIGCGNSIWLSYFKTQFGFEVSGLDYSEYGCEQTRRILFRDGIKGDIYFGDLFNPPAELKNKFDIVCSFGVVEHFDNTEDVLNHIGEFLNEDGILITSIPNLTGVTGWLQKWMNKPVYDIHKVMTLKNIETHIENAGFTIIKSELINPISFGVTLDEIDNKKVKYLHFKKMIIKCFQLTELLARIFNDRIFKLPKNEMFCAGMIVVAKKAKAE